MSCKEYGHGILTIYWKEIFLNDSINKKKKSQLGKNKTIYQEIKTQNFGLPANLAFLLQDPVQQ